MIFYFLKSSDEGTPQLAKLLRISIFMSSPQKSVNN